MRSYTRSRHLRAPFPKRNNIPTFPSCLVSAGPAAAGCTCSAHRLFLWALFSGHLLSDGPQGSRCHPHKSHISWACVPFGPLQSVQTSTIKSGLVYYSVYSANMHFSCVLLCFLPSSGIPNCLIISSRGRTQTQVWFLACAIVFCVTALKHLGCFCLILFSFGSDIAGFLKRS